MAWRISDACFPKELASLEGRLPAQRGNGRGGRKYGDLASEVLQNGRGGCRLPGFQSRRLSKSSHEAVAPDLGPAALELRTWLAMEAWWRAVAGSGCGRSLDSFDLRCVWSRKELPRAPEIGQDCPGYRNPSWFLMLRQVRLNLLSWNAVLAGVSTWRWVSQASPGGTVMRLLSQGSSDWKGLTPSASIEACLKSAAQTQFWVSMLDIGVVQVPSAPATCLGSTPCSS